MNTHSLTGRSRLARAGIVAAVAGALAFAQLAAPQIDSANPAVAQAAATGTPDLRNEMIPPAASADPYAADEVITVIIDLAKPAVMDVPGLVEDYSDPASTGDDAAATTYREQLQDEQANVAKAIAELYPAAQFRYSYTNLINGFAARLPYGLINQVKALPGVADVYVSQTYDERAEDAVESTDAVATDSGSADQMGLNPAWEAGYTGAGKVVAVFDTGIRYTHESFSYMDPAITAAHPDNYKSKQDLIDIVQANPTMNLFRSNWGSWYHEWDKTGFDLETQQQALNGAFWYNEKVPFQADYTGGDFDARSSRQAGGGSGHGTHVAGIAAANAGPNSQSGIKGSAPDAQIMFFKIFDDWDPVGQETDEGLFAALDDAVTLGANSFNLSLGISNGNSTSLTYAQAGYQKAYNRAKAHGIAVQLAAGNAGRLTHSGAIAGTARSAIQPNIGTAGHSDAMFATMSVASANNGGHVAGVLNGAATTTISFTKAADGSPATPASITSANNADLTDMAPGRNPSAVPPNVGLQGLRPGTYQLVDVAAGTEEAILTGSGAASLTGALTGKVALVSGNLATMASRPEPTSPIEINPAVRVIQERLIAAGASAALACGTGNNASALDIPEAFVDPLTLPILGNLGVNNCTTIRTALTANPTGLNVSFNSVRGSFAAGTQNDGGPVASTSWGVTQALDLKADIMAPGGSIYSSTWNHDYSYGNMSGTSMASPNAAGAMLLVQQIVDRKIADGIITGIERGSQAYSDLVDQIAGSNAKPYAAAGNGRYFSPRQQGAGMIRVDKVLNSNVVLHSNLVGNPATGEAPRAKVNLGDQLGNQFSFKVVVDNYNDTARSFAVQSVVQTDHTTVNATSGRHLLDGITAYTANEVQPLSAATIRVTGATGAASFTGGANNINRYGTAPTSATLTVPAKSSTTVTITVDLSLAEIATYDAIFPNGMFLEGFVFFDSTNEKVSLPFMGFRGDWNKPIVFDPMTAYQSRTGKPMTDTDYPIYHVATLATRAGSAERILGANQYSPAAAWPGYQSGQIPTVRTWLDNQRDAGNLKPELTAFSPTGNGQYDIVYANLALLRNVNALAVVIRDQYKNPVKILGPEYNYFELLGNDGLGLQQIATTYGTKYLRNMAWDGTNFAGSKVPDGQYTFEVRGLLEKAYLDDLGYPSNDDAVLSYLVDPSKTKVLIEDFAVKVDTVKPALTVALTANPNEVRVQAADGTGLQAVGLYNGGALIGSVRVPSNPATFDQIIALPAGVDPAKISAQAVDFAGNLASTALLTIDAGALQGLVDHVAAAATSHTPSSWAPVAVALTAARAVLAGNSMTNLTAYQTAYANLLAAFNAATPRGNTTALAALVAAVGNTDQAWKYQASSWTAFQTALAAAKALLASDLSEVGQAAVDAHTAALSNAFLSLSISPQQSQRQALSEAIAAGQAAVASSSGFLADSVAALTTAITAAQAAFNHPTATNAALVEAADAVWSAISALVPAGDGPGLSRLTDAVLSSFVAEAYTSQSWADLEAAAEAARAAAGAGPISSAQVAQLRQALLEAAAALVPLADISLLEWAVSTAWAVVDNAAAYTQDSVDALTVAVWDAKDILDLFEPSQAEVDQAVAAIIQALAGLELDKDQGTGQTLEPVPNPTASGSGSSQPGVDPQSIVPAWHVLRLPTGKAAIPGVVLSLPAPPTGVTVRSYQWMRNGTAITGATASTYTIAVADLNRTLSVQVATVEGTATRQVASTTLFVPKAKVTITAKAVKKSLRASQRAKVRVQVKAPGVTKPTGKVQVRFGLSGGKSVTKTYKLKAAKKGKLTVKLPKLAKGKYVVGVGFKGTDRYNGVKAAKKVSKANKARTFKVTLT